MLSKLLYGDNLEVMRKMQAESVDLIYLDPPFNSNRNYNFLYSQATGKPLPEEAEAFCDAWTLDIAKEEKIREMAEEMLKRGVNSDFLEFWQNWILALRKTNSKLLAYMVFMTERLVEMRRLLKPTGSIYLHCDPTASHYIKVIMDGIFGVKSFRNEVIWSYNWGGRPKDCWGKKHDVIFMYSKDNDRWFFNADSVRVPYKTQIAGRKNPLVDKEKFDKGQIPTDVWDIPIIHANSKERLGYPTQKPLALLDRIIKASCPENGTILDPFCGCGTTVISAQNNQHKWIGIDICMLAVNSVETRLQQLFPLLQKGKDYRLDGLPTTVEQAIELARSSNTTKNEGRYQFQYWAIERVGGFASTKKSGDGGVDGSIYFYKDMEGKKLGKMIISVKSDKKITISYIRDLIGTLSNDSTAEMAGLLCIDEPTEGMRQECLKAGFYEIDYGMMGVQKFPKVQILTVKDIIENNKTFQTPFKVQKKIAEHSNQSENVFSGRQNILV